MSIDTSTWDLSSNLAVTEHSCEGGLGFPLVAAPLLVKGSYSLRQIFSSILRMGNSLATIRGCDYSDETMLGRSACLHFCKAVMAQTYQVTQSAEIPHPHLHPPPHSSERPVEVDEYGQKGQGEP